MSYSIPSSTKILTLATALVLLILVSVLSVYEFAVVPRLYILLSPQEEEVHRRVVQIQQHLHQKDLKLCIPLYHYGKVIAELEKNTNKELNCVWCL